MASIDRYLNQLLERKGSDLHFLAGDPARIRLYGELQALTAEPLNAETVREMLYEIMPKPAKQRFEAQDGTDFAYSIPDVVRNLSNASNGLILVTGKTGSGKSTTLAALINEINSREKGHILTIEDPIEFVHKRKNCLVSQREIGVHSQSFAAALHSALREDPDVILVGELRDLETMSIAVTAAETGILVMGTLHTNGAAATVDRMVNAFPSDKQPHVRTMLSTSLRGVVSQQLIPRADRQGRVAALEVLINTPAVANLIRQGKMDQLDNAMLTSAGIGMRTMDSAIQQLLDQRLITGKDAYKKAINKHRFEQYKDTA